MKEAGFWTIINLSILKTGSPLASDNGSSLQKVCHIGCMRYCLEDDDRFKTRKGTKNSMLQIKEICKEYRTGSLVQKALDKVSLNLRDNEFVAILGPSGSGKTTLLNVIGGLDRYDGGDLNHKRDFDEEIQRPGLGFVSESHDRFCVFKVII